MNRTRKTNQFIILGLGGLLLTASSWAVQRNEKDVGQVAAPFLRVSPSVRMANLGGDQAAASGSIDSLYSNPAGLASIVIPELYLTHHQAFLESRSQTIGFGFPLKTHRFAFSTQYRDGGSHDRTGINPSDDSPILGLGSVRFSTLWLQGAWARKFANRMAVGVSAKGWHQSRDVSSSNGFAVDSGLQIHSVLPHFDLGLVARNVGPDVDGFALPTRFALGSKLHLRPLSSALYSELDLASFRDPAFRLGMEFHKDMLWVRGGYQNVTSDLNESLSNFSFGGGIQLKGWKIDYAWVPQGDLGDHHRFAVTLGFGLTTNERQKMAKMLDTEMSKRMQKQATHFFNQGQAAMKTGQWTEAVEAFSTTLTWDAQHKEARSQRKLAQQKQTFEQGETHYRKGTQHFQQKRWLDAVFYFQQTLSYIPSHKKAKQSLKIAQKALRRQKIPGHASSSDAYNKGVHYYLQGNYNQALKQWSSLLETSAQYPNLLEYIEKAEKMILSERLSKLEKPETPSNNEIIALSKKAYTLYMWGQTEKAIQVWKKILALDPNNKDAKVSLKKAKEKQSLVQDDPNETVSKQVYSLNAKAFKAYSAGDLNQTVTLWRKALLLDPNNIWIQNNLKRVETELAVYDEKARRK